MPPQWKLPTIGKPSRLRIWRNHMADTVLVTSELGSASSFRHDVFRPISYFTSINTGTDMTPHTTEHQGRMTGGDNPPPQSPVFPLGAEHKAPLPQGVEKQAQILIHQAGSLELAKAAVDGAAEREAIPDFREDLFAQRFGFTSRIELLAASTPLVATDGASWWTTSVADNRWIVWNQNDMSASNSYATLQEARSSIYPTIS
jgi:hypothetical protein